MESLTQAIKVLHAEYLVPHILITSVQLPSIGNGSSLAAVGSTITSSNKARIFKVEVPLLEAFFSGTGDIFAALMVVRLREAVSNVEGLGQKDAWISGDEVAAVDLPLAKAAELVLASMQELLSKTKNTRDTVLKKLEDVDSQSLDFHLQKTRSAEVNLVRYVNCLKHPTATFAAKRVEFEA